MSECEVESINRVLCKKFFSQSKLWTSSWSKKVRKRGRARLLDDVLNKLAASNVVLRMGKNMKNKTRKIRRNLRLLFFSSWSFQCVCKKIFASTFQFQFFAVLNVWEMLFFIDIFILLKNGILSHKSCTCRETNSLNSFMADFRTNNFNEILLITMITSIFNQNFSLWFNYLAQMLSKLTRLIGMCVCWQLMKFIYGSCMREEIKSYIYKADW